MQITEPMCREMVEYLEGGGIPRSKYPTATLDQFSLEDDVLYFCKQKIDGTIFYLLIVPNKLRKEALRGVTGRGSVCMTGLPYGSEIIVSYLYMFRYYFKRISRDLAGNCLIFRGNIKKI